MTFESKKNENNQKHSLLIFIKLSVFLRGVIIQSTYKSKGDYTMGSIFEAIMLVCFGLSWPLNVIKAYKARTAKGTSLPFILLIIIGYVAGITAKLVTNQINYVLIVYLINLAIVSANVVIYFRNVALDKRLA